MDRGRGRRVEWFSGRRGEQLQVTLTAGYIYRYCMFRKMSRGLEYFESQSGSRLFVKSRSRQDFYYKNFKKKILCAKIFHLLKKEDATCGQQNKSSRDPVVGPVIDLGQMENIYLPQVYRAFKRIEEKEKDQNRRTANPSIPTPEMVTWEAEKQVPVVDTHPPAQQISKTEKNTVPYSGKQMSNKGKKKGQENILCVVNKMKTEMETKFVPCPVVEQTVKTEKKIRKREKKKRGQASELLSKQAARVQVN
jgi:hypothetical protein